MTAPISPASPQRKTVNVLIIDDEPSMRLLLEQLLTGMGHRTTGADSFQAAMAQLNTQRFDLIFSDIMLGGRDGIALLHEIKHRNLECPVIMITGFPTLQSATEALRLGAFDYLTKPIRLADLEKVTQQALQHHFLRQEHLRVQKNLHALFGSVRDALFLIDSGGIIQEINPSAKTLCQIDPVRAIRTPFQDQLVGCNGGCVAAVRQTLSTGTPCHINRLECVMARGPVQVNEITVTPVLHEDGTVHGCVLVVHNQTYLVTLEQSLETRHQFHRLIGKSPKMLQLYDLIEHLGTVNTTVLISGESGTGKELVAEAIHRQRPDWTLVPMVKVNCAALSEQLLESELFGHVKGAFTGALKDRIGRFERANSGTLFLDEIGDISPRMQLQLLRVIQEREFERVGDSTPIRVQFRLIVATHQDLKQKVRAGTFREDLYHRLNVVNPHLPPLRERREDIPLLVQHFLEKFNHVFKKRIDKFSGGVLRHLLNHPWPGNVRELENTLEHACLLCNGTTLFTTHLPLDPSKEERLEPTPPVPPLPRSDIDLPPAMETAQRILTQKLRKRRPEADDLLRALEQTRWNKTEAARVLGISRRTFYRLLDRIEMETPTG
ncbi:MAG: sigma 54-interacting transcriptional regulator [Magnetococcales bacterium]|nr:sigma 54-interacting transcriptional regulator [Magnetococcales bacterium]MBF0630490.1 sigma 54-interacting transcriptional regulator [Magnetococcales bacterium]